MKFGILTSGGDCAGLNAVIRSIGLYLLSNVKNAEIVGIPEGYAGLIRGESYPMKREDFEGLLTEGGTILRTRRTPFKRMTVPEEGGTRLSKMLANYKKMGLDCLFTLGGAGTHKTAALLSMEGCNVIGVPKTIDNDIFGTDVTFGFQTAVEVVTDAFDRIDEDAGTDAGFFKEKGLCGFGDRRRIGKIKGVRFCQRRRILPAVCGECFQKQGQAPARRGAEKARCGGRQYCICIGGFAG